MPTRVMPWTIPFLLMMVGFIIPVVGPVYFGLSPTDNAVLSGAMGGALVGAGGALLATLVAEYLQRSTTASAAHKRCQNAKKLIAAELVDVAMGLINSKRTIDIAISTAQAGGTLPQQEYFGGEMPRSTPFTDGLGSDLLILESDAVDTIVTLKANLARTGEGFDEITSGRRLFNLFSAISLSGALRHDLNLLAECFEKIAPDRKFQLYTDREPELASSALRRLADTDMSRERIGY